MPTLFWDIETRSAENLETVGAWRYAGSPTTEVLCVGFAVDDGDPKIWTPDQPIPCEFLEAAGDPGWVLVAHNAQFERAIERCVLHPRYGWPVVADAQRRCTMAAALANALPASLDKCAAALGLPVGKDPQGYRLMKMMARPRRPRKGESPGLYWNDGPELREQLHVYCKRDVDITRALARVLPPLTPAEQIVWQIDAIINERGFFCDVALARAAADVAERERAALDAEIAELTDGEITSVNQVGKIQAFLRRNGHTLTSLTKGSVSAVLAHRPDDDGVRRLLELRQQGALASARKFDSLLASVDEDGRLRGTLRYHGGAPGRWSGRGFQPQNLKKPSIPDLDAAVDAIRAGDLDRVRALGAPLVMAGEISRAIICAPPGRNLIGGDFSAVESRVLAWLADETWKIENYRDYDRTGDPALEPYCVTASRLLGRAVTPDDEIGRQIGKTADLALGFGGSVGAWRRFDPNDARSDSEIKTDVIKWRSEHPNIVRFWRALENGLIRALITGERVALGDRLSFQAENGTLYLTLPSGRRLAYPEARLGPGKFENTRQIYFKDNARGGWTEVSGWYGSFTENVVQAVARDLLAAALLRLEAANFAVVLHVHDEVIAEIDDDGRDRRDEFLRTLTELPGWAEGLPIAAKVWSGRRYAKTKSEAQSTQPEQCAAAETAAVHTVNSTKVHLESTSTEGKPKVRQAADEEDEGLGVSLADLIGGPTVDGKILCPFHDDNNPSLHIYDDHFHCFACGAHGDRIDWLMMVEGLTRDEALSVIETWSGPTRPLRPPRRNDEDARRESALRLWEAAGPITNTLAMRYLAEKRRIDLASLPPNIDEVLRFHPCCPFGIGTRHPCLIAMMRDIATDAPTGIHRIGLAPDASKIERRMLGRGGAVKLWPAGKQLVVGEGIETVLAAATRIPYRGAPLQPAWSAVSSGALGKFPVVPGVERLIMLVDHDHNGIGQADASALRRAVDQRRAHRCPAHAEAPGRRFQRSRHG